jgi:hypothetical protein
MINTSEKQKPPAKGNSLRDGAQAAVGYELSQTSFQASKDFQASEDRAKQTLCARN